MNYNRRPTHSECASHDPLPTPAQNPDLHRRSGALARRLVFPLRRSLPGDPNFLAHRDFGADADDDGRLSALGGACRAAARRRREEIAHLFILPAKAGKGDHAKRGGRGVGLNATLSTTARRRVRRPFHRARARSPSPVFTGEEKKAQLFSGSLTFGNVSNSFAQRCPSIFSTLRM